MQRTVILIALALCACGRSDLVEDERLAPETPAVPPVKSSEPAPCGVELPGDRFVRFDFPAQRCRFTLAEAAEGITFRYGVEVIADEPAMVESASLSEQSCALPMAGPNLFLLERVSGGAQSFCDCDHGWLCPVAPRLVRGATPGRFERRLTWDGRNWNGPSDTGTARGTPFPPGEYVVSIQALVSDARIDESARLVTAKLHFTLIP
jgi:hypothetical protein